MKTRSMIFRSIHYSIACLSIIVLSHAILLNTNAIAQVQHDSLKVLNATKGELSRPGSARGDPGKKASTPPSDSSMRNRVDMASSGNGAPTGGSMGPKPNAPVLGEPFANVSIKDGKIIVEGTTDGGNPYKVESDYISDMTGQPKAYVFSKIGNQRTIYCIFENIVRLVELQLNETTGRAKFSERTAKTGATKTIINGGLVLIPVSNINACSVITPFGEYTFSYGDYPIFEKNVHGTSNGSYFMMNAENIFILKDGKVLRIPLALVFGNDTPLLNASETTTQLVGDEWVYVKNDNILDKKTKKPKVAKVNLIDMGKSRTDVENGIVQK